MMNGLKCRIETSLFKQSVNFYNKILDMEILEYWDRNHDKGAILGLSKRYDGQAFIELAYSETVHKFNAFSLQFRVDNISIINAKIRNKVSVQGPTKRPWGSTYLYLKDPNDLQIILYEGVL